MPNHFKLNNNYNNINSLSTFPEIHYSIIYGFPLWSYLLTEPCVCTQHVCFTNPIPVFYLAQHEMELFLCEKLANVCLRWFDIFFFLEVLEIVSMLFTVYYGPGNKWYKEHFSMISLLHVPIPTLLMESGRNVYPTEVSTHFHVNIRFLCTEVWVLFQD